MRAWVARYAEIHARYEPVFHALESDDVLAAVARRTGEETVARIHARLATTTLPPRQLDPVIRLLLECLNHTLDVSGILRSVAPDAYPTRARRDRPHRRAAPHAVRPARRRERARARRRAAARARVRPGDARAAPARTARSTRTRSGNRALDALLASGRDVFVERGYHNTRVDDLVAAAGVSHGAFYRYFRNKEQLARILTARAVQAVGDGGDRDPRRRPRSTAPTGKSVAAPVAAPLPRRARQRGGDAARLGRRRAPGPGAPGRVRAAARLGPAADGARTCDRAASATSTSRRVVMVALLGVFGARPRPAAEVDAAAHDHRARAARAADTRDGSTQ